MGHTVHTYNIPIGTLQLQNITIINNTKIKYKYDRKITDGAYECMCVCVCVAGV